MNYITDFQEIVKKLEKNEQFLRNGGSIIEFDGYTSTATVRLLYSIYLYILTYEKPTLKNVSEYIETMEKYVKFGKTYEYHCVNVARLRIEEDYSEPMYMCESADLHNPIFASDVFMAMWALKNTPKLLSELIRIFDKETK